NPKIQNFETLSFFLCLLLKLASVPQACRSFVACCCYNSFSFSFSFSSPFSAARRLWCCGVVAIATACALQAVVAQRHFFSLRCHSSMICRTPVLAIELRNPLSLCVRGSILHCSFEAEVMTTSFFSLEKL
ncbi:hypothetical protein BVRB_8g188150, partial [Beta vulgaris subsp. vulgaris]